MNSVFPPESADTENKVRVGYAQVGYLCGFNQRGLPLVDFPGNAGGPIAARVGLFDAFHERGIKKLGRFVVLVFEDGDPERPIIVGFVQEEKSSDDEITEGEGPDKADIAGDVIKQPDLLIEAEEELTIRCGKASITIRKDGKIVIFGTNVTTRATNVNKIKGGAVRIN